LSIDGLVDIANGLRNRKWVLDNGFGDMKIDLDFMDGIGLTGYWVWVGEK